MKRKILDIVDIKTEIKNGRLESYIKFNRSTKLIDIYIRDKENGETVKIGEVNKVYE